MFINISYKYKSKNYDLRKKKISFIIIHYTETKTLEEAIKILTSKKSKVSSHFVIDRNGDIYNLVKIKFRAWHAGVSKWKRTNDINSRSIGIELVNAGEKSNEEFSNLQIDNLIKLIIQLKEEYNINSKDILGHSDIAPSRKIDPGIYFPWKKLFKFSLGNWTKTRGKKKPLQQDEKYFLLKNLKRIGYPIVNINDNQTNNKVVDAFHRHYLTELVGHSADQRSLLKSVDLLKNN